jgi:NAD(P)-dependent dehydrogenase (short-subunit alcohol dehydrogenase family)
MTTASPPTTKPLTWLITGCSSSFGLQMARHVLAAGHHVVRDVARPRARTPDLVAEIRTAQPPPIEIDVLVNNAGFAMAGALEHFADDEVRALLETNFLGPYRLLRAVVPRMRRRRVGVVVNLSSGAGLEARESLGVYGASKSAMNSEYFCFVLFGFHLAVLYSRSPFLCFLSLFPL